MPRSVVTSLLLALCALGVLPQTGLAVEAQPWITSGLYNPLYLTSPPGDTERAFLVEQRGRILIHRDGGLLPTAFLDIEAIVHDGGERGLLGLAFHPDYDQNGEFYLDYTQSRNDSLFTRIVRYQVSGNPDVANPSSEELLLEIYQPFSNHNGGMIAFGPDGYLYIGMGDGGSGGDPQNNGQNGQSLLGKLLRIDVDGAAPYAIPADNPFVGQAPRDEIWALGMRNPWRFSFDRLTGDLWIGDVGQNQWEEVDFQPAASPGGENYGWKIMEAAHCYSPPIDCDDTGLTYPVHEYNHSTGCSITGGYLYRGSSAPDIYNRYLFADYCNGRVWALDPGDFTVTELFPGQSLGNVVSFGEDGNGDVYVIDGPAGDVYKLVSEGTAVGDLPLENRDLRLVSAAPNPFGRQTAIQLSLERSGHLEAGIYNVSGRLVRQLHSGLAAAGPLRLRWDGRDGNGRSLASGVYFLRAETPRERLAAPLTLLR